MHNFTILLVEDDTAACNAFAKYTETLDDVSLVSVTNSAATALTEIYDYLPDAVILDLELHHGEGSGLDVLRGLKDMALSVYPYILITTNNISNITYEYARQLGADYIMSKYQEGYSEKNVIDFLYMMKPAIRRCRKPAPPLTTESPEKRKQRILHRITAELDYVGINPKSSGYKYLTDAIMITMDKPTPNIAKLLGEKYGKTEDGVKRAMVGAINRAWKQTDINDLLYHYTAKIHSEKGIPTINEFVYYYANKLNNDY